MIKKTLVPCNICGNELFDVASPDELGDSAATIDYNFSPDTRKTYQIVKCRTCGMIFTNPMPALEATYEETRDEVYLRSRPQRIRTAENVVERIRRYQSHGRLLDVGCSTGILLDAAAPYYDVEGIELSRWAYEEASARHKVYNQTLGALRLEPQNDVVTLMGVIEHFEDPTRELREINRVLKPGGLFVIYFDTLLPMLFQDRRCQ